MPPPETAATPATYGVVQMPGVMETIEHVNSAAQWPLTQAIFKLQTDPRPEGHEPADEYGEGFALILVRVTSPPYQITYVVDDKNKRVTVLAITEARWKQ